MLGRKIQDSLPRQTNTRAIDSEWDTNDITEFQNKKREQTRTYYNRRTRPLQPLKLGQWVTVQHHQNKKWIMRRKITGVLKNRAYKLRLLSGTILIRNRRQIRPIPPAVGPTVNPPTVTGNVKIALKPDTQTATQASEVRGRPRTGRQWKTPRRYSPSSD
jgi:hypothetical protein